MNYETFEKLWKEIVTHKTVSVTTCAPGTSLPFNNGSSDKLVNALIADADGDHSVIDGVKKKLNAAVA